VLGLDVGSILGLDSVGRHDVKMRDRIEEGRSLPPFVAPSIVDAQTF
jgi:hypothetical protein